MGRRLLGHEPNVHGGDEQVASRDREIREHGVTLGPSG
jgi:hypothetical protein